MRLNIWAGRLWCMVGHGHSPVHPRWWSDEEIHRHQSSHIHHKFLLVFCIFFRGSVIAVLPFPSLKSPAFKPQDWFFRLSLYFCWFHLLFCPNWNQPLLVWIKMWKWIKEWNSYVYKWSNDLPLTVRIPCKCVISLLVFHSFPPQSVSLPYL